MSEESDELVNELVSASIAFGREREPDWQTRIEKARVALKAYMERLGGAQRWIPVCEGFPEDGVDVLIWDGNRTRIGYYLVFSGTFMDGDNPLRRIIVTHWMPLPKPPEVQE